jgi:dipeptidyl aminopeptidase/acylaminoacyl peptidase
MITKKVFLKSSLLFLSMQVYGQNSLTVESMISLKRVSKPVSNVEGTKFIYDVNEVSIADNKGQKDLYVYDVNAKTNVRLTETKYSEFAGRFSMNGNSYYYLSTEKDGAQVWSMSIDGSVKKQLTSLENGVGDFQFSKTEKLFAALSDVKTGNSIHDIFPDLPKTDARIIDDLNYRHWDDWDDYMSTHLMIASVTDGVISSELIDINKGEAFDVEQFDISPDGKFVVYTAKKLNGKAASTSTNTDLYLFSLETKTSENISLDNFGYDRNAKFSPDGKYICYESMTTPGYEADRSRLMLYDIANKSKKDITATMEENAENLTWSKDSKRIYFTSPLQATEQIFSIEIANQKIVQITSGDHDITSIEIASADQLLYTKMSISSPLSIFLYNVKSKQELQVSHVNDDALSKIKMGKVEKNWVKTTDGKQELVWVIYPPDFDATKKYPALLYCQGGPQSAVSQFFSYRWNFQLMASNGYIVVAPNRRGLPGFGKKWNDDITENWGAQSIDDYLSAVDSISKRSFIDKNRLGCVGASYGGYSAYWLAGHHNKRFKSFIAHCGLFNLESWYTMTDENFFSRHDIGEGYWKSPTPKSFEKFSPHKFLANWDTPILVIHDEKDFRVPVSEGMQAFGAAQLMGLKSKFLYIPDEGHWVMKPQNSVVWHRVFYSWLAETLK